MKRSAVVIALAAATPALALAQGGSTHQAPSAVSTVRAVYEQMTGYIARAADQMTEANYAFKPTADVRTFGQLIGHVAGAQQMICAAALGEKQGNEDDIEKSATTKAALVAAMKKTTEHCRRAYAQTDAAAAGQTTLFGQQNTRLYALMLNASHNSEHYGNLVTYMRMKGMVPPSSQR